MSYTLVKTEVTISVNLGVNSDPKLKQVQAANHNDVTILCGVGVVVVVAGGRAGETTIKSMSKKITHTKPPKRKKHGQVAKTRDTERKKKSHTIQVQTYFVQNECYSDWSVTVQ